MKIDESKIDDAVLALLGLPLHDGNRAWKGFDWSSLERLHNNGWNDNPASKAKSIVLTDEGVARSHQLFQALFTQPDQEPRP